MASGNNILDYKFLDSDKLLNSLGQLKYCPRCLFSEGVPYTIHNSQAGNKSFLFECEECQTKLYIPQKPTEKMKNIKGSLSSFYHKLVKEHHGNTVKLIDFLKQASSGVIETAPTGEEPSVKYTGQKREPTPRPLEVIPSHEESQRNLVCVLTEINQTLHEIKNSHTTYHEQFIKTHKASHKMQFETLLKMSKNMADLCIALKPANTSSESSVSDGESLFDESQAPFTPDMIGDDEIGEDGWQSVQPKKKRKI